ncbi:MAG: hypothetical protein ABIG61_15960 [Planctomycetota bacterium]
MFDVFEQPWLLLIAAVVIHFILGVVRFIKADRRRWWYYVPAIALVFAAIGLDFFVRTDLEKVNAVIKNCKKAVETQDVKMLVSYVAPDYYDSGNHTHRSFVNLCDSLLSEPLVEKATIMNKQIELGTLKTNVLMSVWLKLHEQNTVARYKTVAAVRIKLIFTKQPDRKWLIRGLEILEVDNHPVNWRDCGL